MGGKTAASKLSKFALALGLDMGHGYTRCSAAVLAETLQVSEDEKAEAYVPRAEWVLGSDTLRGPSGESLLAALEPVGVTVEKLETMVLAMRDKTRQAESDGFSSIVLFDLRNKWVSVDDVEAKPGLHPLLPDLRFDAGICKDKGWANEVCEDTGLRRYLSELHLVTGNSAPLPEMYLNGSLIRHVQWHRKLAWATVTSEGCFVDQPHLSIMCGFNIGGSEMDVSHLRELRQIDQLRLNPFGGHPGGEASIGKSIEVYWPNDKKFYACTIAGYAEEECKFGNKHLYDLDYADGDVEIKKDLEFDTWRYSQGEAQDNQRAYQPILPATRPDRPPSSPFSLQLCASGEERRSL